MCKGCLEVPGTMHGVALMNTIFGCLSVLVSCKARPHSGEGETEAMCLTGSAHLLLNLSLASVVPGGCLSG